MTRKEAKVILARIAAGEFELARPKHATDELLGHGFTLQDIRPLVRAGVLEKAPEWNEEHAEYRVRILGKSLEGRTSRLVLGLRPGGTHTLITIMPVRPKLQAGAKRRKRQRGR